MPRCPVCQTKYVADKTENCSVCGWNLQAHSLLIGLIPEVSLKEQTRLEWAQNIWATVKPAREQIQQFQSQLQEGDQTIAQLHLELEQANQQCQKLLATLQQRESDLTGLLSQSDQLNHELSDLRGQLEQTNQLQVQSPTPEIIEAESQGQTLLELEQSQITTALPIKVQTLIFQVVTVDTQGQLANCYGSEAHYFQEELENVALDMIILPGGVFWMGSQEAEQGRESHEEPQHQVTIEPFCMGRFTITQAQWRAIANLPTIHRSLDPEPAHTKGENQPVEQVSWHDAIEFCARLTKLTRRDYRLPSEAEWEYACRARTTTPFHFGETITPELANYDGNYIYNLEPVGQYRQRTVPVGSFQVANAFGLCDMHGNVWEWCADAWHDNYQEGPCDGSVWEQAELQHRLLRGGSWYCLPSLCRAAQRHWDKADHGGSGIGFRVVCSSARQGARENNK
ncbi:Formylglycine-generating enzyme, required for sulfatase activity, containings SUMF1/FGE domain (plasmid) [Nostoc flagelliforme CCNUN1]|uniref:Formylglycine-generating enzyme, required for sulfatase activity, containings SUMF1/FGE domain n=1 Tax=Nostoc flagelliforme CCNUN1 TaxID=2038116 RepID=A0A2K8T8E7_9NOSO|nr:SUMF1/EgtB/PvdO family nonheme iron enzyme [Nostoc flagelliforme]AUB43919.1 Formylglycine-generating enzyme, required for sulfatase activity, containings SUMF1/FGE domain [Nostoc flagelliforme CCNUN1]